MEPGTWSPAYNWTKQEVLDALARFERSSDETFNLNMDHTDWKNDEDVPRWCQEAGYDARYDQMGEVVRVSKRKQQES